MAQSDLTWEPDVNHEWIHRHSLTDTGPLLLRLTQWYLGRQYTYGAGLLLPDHVQQHPGVNTTSNHL